MKTRLSLVVYEVGVHGKFMGNMLAKLAEGVLDLLFPASCVGGHPRGPLGMVQIKPDGSYVCWRHEAFLGEAALICPVCGQSSFTGERHQTCVSTYGLDGLASIWEYEGIARGLLHAVKYKGITHAKREIMTRVFQAMTQDRYRFSPFLHFLLRHDPTITYVPMWNRKERERGFNQAKLFAQELSKVGDGRTVLPLLEKGKNTPPQVDLGKEERLQNVKGSFGIAKKAPTQLPENVILVDDVWTTGATMRECCKVLKRAGVGAIWGFTVARTV